MSNETELSDHELASSIPMPIDVVDPTNEDDVLKRTQDLRLRIAAKMSCDQNIQSDMKALAQLNKLIDGADKQVFSSRKMRLMERDTAAAESVAAVLDRYVTESGATIKRHDGDEPAGDYRPQRPQLPNFQMKEGELAPVGQTVDVDSIMATALQKLRPGDEDQG